MSVRSPRSSFMAASTHCPIAVPVGVEYDAVLDAVVTRLKEVSELINPVE